jgi:cytoskeletal protein CcmA (bactofilin family)
MNKIHTVIGKSTHVQGDVEFSGGLHLDGRISGNVRANPGSNSTLSVSEYGRIDGAVEAANVILDGTVAGPIRASGRVVMGCSARVLGDVHYGVIEMALGAEIIGRLVPATPDPVGVRDAATAEVKLHGAL